MNKNLKKNQQNKNSNFSKPNNFDQNWIYGKHPVLAVILKQKRKLHKILLTQKSANELAQELAKNKVQVDPNLIYIVDNNFLTNNLPENAVHQGFALKASSTPLIQEDDFILGISKKEKLDLPPLLILDQLTDPHNIGAIIRSAIAFGVTNIVIPKHNFPKESAIMNKSSSGMIEMADLIMVSNINNFMIDLKKLGYWCIGLAGEGKELLTKAKEFNPVALIIGSEGDGIRELVKKNCDLLVKIPMSSEVESLNASNAAAISLYELFGKN